MNRNLKLLIVTTMAPIVVGSCCTSPGAKEWEYKVVAGNANANVVSAMNSPEKQEAFLNAQGKEGWIFVQQEGGFDIALSVACCMWVFCAFAMFFRTWWAWWGTMIILCALAAFFTRGIIRAVFEVGSGQSLTRADGWPGWTVMMAFFLPTLGLLATIAFTGRFYDPRRAPAIA